MKNTDESKTAPQDVIPETLKLSRNLQVVIGRLHENRKIDRIMLELRQDILTMFSADRMIVYVVSEDKQAIISKVKMGFKFKDLKLPISEQSIAGYCAANKEVINIQDAYDDRELKSYSTQLHFLNEVDRRTGYRTKRILAVPIVDSTSKELMGVIQIINSKDNQPFTEMIVEGVTHLAESLAIRFRHRPPLWRPL